MAVDLHTHSNKSDGSFTPKELVDYAAKKGLKAIALTDHDTVDGVREALDEAAKLKKDGVDIEVIPGIEFSTEYCGRDIHMVGLFLDIDSAYFQRRLELFRKSRDTRNEIMAMRLKKFGFDISIDELKETYPDAVITRAHFGKLMLKKGYVSSVKEAFDRYIGDKAPCFVPRKKISPFRAIEIIRRAGGYPVLAHPVLYGMGKQKLEELTRSLKDAGLRGIEAIYSTYTPSDERDIRALAGKFGLVISGGSDFHGSAKPGLDLGCGYGHLYIDDEILLNIKRDHEKISKNTDFRLRKILFTDLDGTLLRDDKTISDYTYDVLKRWADAGHFIALCSGRDINSVNCVVKDLNLDTLPNIYTIGYNGGQIMDYESRTTLHKTTLPLEDVEYIVDFAQENSIYIQTYNDTNIIVSEITDETRYYTNVIKTPVLETGNIMSVFKDEGPCKCLAIELKDTDKLEDFRLKLLPWADEHKIELVYSNPYYLEFFPKESGKGSAVLNLKKALDIPGIVTVAAGDERNDVSMLQSADVAIAMKNGADEIKDASGTITEYDNDHDGLAFALEDII